MKVPIGKGPLFTAFHNARMALPKPMSFIEDIKLFENTYDIKFINDCASWSGDQLIFKSEVDYFAFLMRWS